MSDVLILYQISNEFSCSKATPTPTGYNAFYLPRKNNGITLSSIKSHIRTSLGHDQFHWRVRIDDRPATSNSSSVSSSSSSSNGGKLKYSWWDIQDENARLPIKEASPKELKKMFGPPKKEEGNDIVTQEVTKAAKGAMKYMGKAMNVVSGSHGGGRDHSGQNYGGGYEDDGMEDDFGQRTAVICFKVLDLNRVRMDCSIGGGGGVVRRASGVPRRTSSNASAVAQQQRPTRSNSGRGAASAGAPRIPSHRSSSTMASSVHATPANTSAPTGNLMDFGSTSSSSAAAASSSSMMSTPQQSQRTASSSLHSSTSKSTPTGKAHPNETRAEKLKREYAKKNAQSNRVWDEVDQRWVEGPIKNGEVSTSVAASRSTSTPKSSSSAAATPNNGVASTTKAVKGISLSTTNAIGKSASVQAAVHARVAEMESSQQKALSELRDREAAKANADAAEDLVRQRLEPKLKAWSEEHGQKKQLRALLANLHTILWEGSGWKQVSLADVLEDGKVKRVYHKASRVVHPDKTMGLDVEKKFVAKRVFDALTQAKVAFDEGKR